MLYQVALVIHIIGFIVTIGITLASFQAYQQFWKLYAFNKEQGLAAFRSFKSMQVIGLFGLLALIISGVAMLALVHWTFLSLLWFQVKLGLVVLIFVNGFTLGRGSTMQLQAFLKQEQSDKSIIEVNKIRSRLQNFQLIQLAIFLGIIILTVFRFN